MIHYSISEHEPTRNLLNFVIVTIKKQQNIFDGTIFFSYSNPIHTF